MHCPQIASWVRVYISVGGRDRKPDSKALYYLVHVKEEAKLRASLTVSGKKRESKVTTQIYWDKMEILDTIPAFNRFVPLIPKRSCRKPLGDVGDVAVQAVLVTGISSKLQSGKSAKGATPFRSLRSPGVTAEAGLYAG
jgi:hypothetical protein